MIGVKIRVGGTVGRWLDGVGKALGRKSAEAAEEISGEQGSGPQDDAEEALWQAMGWDQSGESTGRVVRSKIGEAMGGR